MLALLLAVALSGPAAAGEAAPPGCPPFGSARCPEQGGCGAHPQHNLAYALRVGHLDYDWVSQKLYNPGTKGPDDWKNWDYFDAPSFENEKEWCLEECGTQDKGAGCVPRLKKAAPPAARPPHPPVMRCFKGDPSGGIDYKKYPNCGTSSSGTPWNPSADASALASQMTGDELWLCTGGNPKCICVKGKGGYHKFETAAVTATGEAFPGQDGKPAGMKDEEATKRICAAYNKNPTLGEGTLCRAQADEIVLEAPEKAPNRRYPTVSLDVVTAAGKFWRKAIAACEPGVQ